ncbi:hypothetical protein FHR75_003860 [Kineococcus radiotolerans]|uniref:Uncharacterized protein n=1 Tax=Kineococcus radiotolerans TaxID=131568 RepID=A0A7W4TQ76_KINRA|nr:hypothetical protein [Kineococcus radiotolerans]MBB2903024.1 hypothetical protein [Kineococcus radiotolerans]
MPDPISDRLRSDLHRTWDDVAAGRLSRAAAADWAADPGRAVDYSGGPEPLQQAWLLLHDLRRAPRDEAAAISGGHHGRDELAARWREQWCAELARYDADPLTWNRAYWSAYLRRTAGAGHHPAPARLAARLVEHGLILDQAVHLLAPGGPAGHLAGVSRAH